MRVVKREGQTFEEDLSYLDEPDPLQQHQLAPKRGQHKAPRESACTSSIHSCTCNPHEDNTPSGIHPVLGIAHGPHLCSVPSMLMYRRRCWRSHLYSPKQTSEAAKTRTTSRKCRLQSSGVPFRWNANSSPSAAKANPRNACTP